MKSRITEFNFDKFSANGQPSLEKFADNERRRELGIALGIGDKLIIAAPEDRAHQSSKGMSFYWRSDWCGIHLPFSPFVVDILRTLRVAPAQLAAVAWCHINSFEDMFYCNDLYFGNLPDKMPTLSLFLEFYEFVRSNSWISIRKRTDCFASINKIEDWSKGFYYLPHSEITPELLGNINIRTEWNEKVELPGRRFLTKIEKRMYQLVLRKYKRGIQSDYPCMNI